jgi:hypothetical protein
MVISEIRKKKKTMVLWLTLIVVVQENGKTDYMKIV